MNHFPAVEIANKQYSLDADIITGWRPKNKILGPIPFNFDSSLLDEIVDELTSFGSRHKERVIYLGIIAIKKVIDSQIASKCIKKLIEDILLSMKAQLIPIFSIWQLTFESSIQTLNRRILVYLRE